MFYSIYTLFNTGGHGNSHRYITAPMSAVAATCMVSRSTEINHSHVVYTIPGDRVTYPGPLVTMSNR